MTRAALFIVVSCVSVLAHAERIDCYYGTNTKYPTVPNPTLYAVISATGFTDSFYQYQVHANLHSTTYYRACDPNYGPWGCLPDPYNRFPGSALPLDYVLAKPPYADRYDGIFTSQQGTIIYVSWVGLWVNTSSLRQCYNIGGWVTPR